MSQQSLCYDGNGLFIRFQNDLFKIIILHNFSCTAIFFKYRNLLLLIKNQSSCYTVRIRSFISSRLFLTCVNQLTTVNLGTQENTNLLMKISDRETKELIHTVYFHIFKLVDFEPYSKSVLPKHTYSLCHKHLFFSIL